MAAIIVEKEFLFFFEFSLFPVFLWNGLTSHSIVHSRLEDTLLVQSPIGHIILASGEWELCDQFSLIRNLCGFPDHGRLLCLKYALFCQ